MNLRKVVGSIACFLVATMSFADPSPDPISGHYYEDAVSVVTWDQARVDSATNFFFGTAGHLATIQDERENEIVEHLGNSGVSWIGLTDSTNTTVKNHHPGPKAAGMRSFTASAQKWTPILRRERVFSRRSRV
jgi:hypothetical protein